METIKLFLVHLSHMCEGIVSFISEMFSMTQKTRLAYVLIMFYVTATLYMFYNKNEKYHDQFIDELISTNCANLY